MYIYEFISAHCIGILTIFSVLTGAQGISYFYRDLVETSLLKVNLIISKICLPTQCSILLCVDSHSSVEGFTV